MKKETQNNGQNNGQNPPENGVWKSGRGKGRKTLKGRQVETDAATQVQALLKDRPQSRDLLIEHLHLIQDKYGHISAAHLCALADDMRLSQAEVYEVATFYAHFDVIKEDETPLPSLTIRVCDSLSCELAGAQTLLTCVKKRAGWQRRAGSARPLYGAVRYRADLGNRA